MDAILVAQKESGGHCVFCRYNSLLIEDSSVRNNKAFTVWSRGNVIGMKIVMVKGGW